MRVLVTGGAGFIGSNLVSELIAEGFEVYVLDNLSNGNKLNIEFIEKKYKEKIRIFEESICDLDSTLKVFNEVLPSWVIHLAAKVSVKESLEFPKLYIENNLTGTKNVILASEKTKVEFISYASSASVYGDQASPLLEDMANYTSDYIDSLLSPYAQTKLQAEQLISESHIKSICFRFFNVFGEGQSLSESYTPVITKFLNNVVNDKPLVVYGDGEQTRDFIDLSDLVSVMIKTHEALITGVYNLGSGHEVSLNFLIDLIKKVSKKEIVIEFEQARAGEITKSGCSIEKLRSKINITKDNTLELGLARVYKYILEN